MLDNKQFKNVHRSFWNPELADCCLPQYFMAINNTAIKYTKEQGELVLFLYKKIKALGQYFEK